MSLSLFSQVPQGFRYQAVMRDDAGELIRDREIKVKIGVLEGGSSGTLLWEEEHTVTTNDLGLFSLMVGDPLTTQTGGTASSFDEIDWAAGDHYLQVSVDLEDGNGYHTLGEDALLSVPYALYARDVTNKDDADHDPQNEIQDLQLNGNVLTITNNSGATQIDLSSYLDNPGWNKTGDTLTYPGSVGVGTETVRGSKLAVQGDDVMDEAPLFEVKRKDGQPVFSVYNDSVVIHVNDAAAKGPRGGFIIGGFSLDKGGGGQDYLRVTPDSVRIYIDPSDAKGRRGGFAIGGYGPLKGSVQEYLRVTDDSTRVYVNTSPAKRPRGGFAIGGFDISKGSVTDFMHMTKDNYLVGHNAGRSLTSGLYNSFMGYESGINTKEGAHNIFLGFRAGYNNTGSATDDRMGSHNIFLGNESGFKNERGYRNVYIGFHSGYNSVFSYNNTYVGYNSGLGNVSGYSNVFVGDDAGRSNTSGFYNTFVGSQSGFSNTQGYFNTFLGYATGKANTTGNQNVFIGKECGSQNTTGSFNVFMGNESGVYNTDGRDNVFIGDHSGYRNTGGDYNTFIGYWSGYQNRTGLNNIYIGFKAGELDQTGTSNIFLGNQSGENSNGSQQNIALGVESGRYIGNARYNSLMGYKSGFYNKGWYNTILGYMAGYGVSGSTTGARNVFIGTNAGYRITSGGSNVFMGYKSGYTNSSGNDNVFIGNSAGYLNKTGKQNVCVGPSAGYNILGNNNVCIGTAAGLGYTGSNRLYIANSSMTTLIYGEFDNQIVGFTAKVGVGTKAPSERLDVRGHIRNSSDATYDVWIQGGSATSGGTRNLALLGNKSTDKLYVNYGGEYAGGTIIGGNVGIGTNTPIERLHVVGDAYVTSKLFVGGNVYQRVDGTSQGWHKLDDQAGNDMAQWYETSYVPSDRRLKTDIQSIEGALEKVEQLHGVTFSWNEDGQRYFTGFADHIIAGPGALEAENEKAREEVREYYRQKFEGRSLGLIAQDVMKVMPEAVHSTEEGYLKVSYGSLVGLTVEAIKEQQKTIEMQGKEIERLKRELTEMETLKNRIKQLERIMNIMAEREQDE